MVAPRLGIFALVIFLILVTRTYSHRPIILRFHEVNPLMTEVLRVSVKRIAQIEIFNRKLWASQRASETPVASVDRESSSLSYWAKNVQFCARATRQGAPP